MNIYKVPVVWTMMGYILQEASSPEEAKELAKKYIDEFPLPKNASYLEDSFEIDEEGEPWPLEE